MADTYQIAIEGKALEAKAFIEGLIVGANAYGEVVFLDDLKVNSEGLLDWFIKQVTLKENAVHLLVQSDLLDLITKGIQDQSQDLSLKLRGVRKVKGARFDFSIECFSPEHGKSILALFDALPEGAALSKDARIEEKLDPEAQGVEMYSPAHHYELRGSGVVEGLAKGVIQAYEIASEEALVRLGHIEFDFE